MSSSFQINSLCRYCSTGFKSVESLTTHEETCLLRKVKEIEQANKGVTECSYCKIKLQPLKPHNCKQRITELVQHLLTQPCSEWMKSYIIHEVLGFKSAEFSTSPDSKDLVISQAILTAVKKPDA